MTIPTPTQTHQDVLDLIESLQPKAAPAVQNAISWALLALLARPAMQVEASLVRDEQTPAQASLTLPNGIDPEGKP